MSVQATEMSAIKFVRSVCVGPAVRCAMLSMTDAVTPGLGVLPSQLGSRTSVRVYHIHTIDILPIHQNATNLTRGQSTRWRERYSIPRLVTHVSPD